jgi:hypothetical protein
MAITKEKAIELMKPRGYNMVSEAGNGSWVAFAKDLNGFWMHATVYLERESINMTAGILKLVCKLSCDSIDVNTKKFEDYEKTLYFYAKVCSEIDELVEEKGLVGKKFNEALLSFAPEPVTEEPKKEKTLEERIEAFRKQVVKAGKEKNYPPLMCKQFFEYWSEANAKRMRWEIQKAKGGVFDLHRRLATWASKDVVYNAKFKDREEKKAEKQNTELQQRKSTSINTKELF